MLHFIRWRLGLDAASTQTTAEERKCLLEVSKGKKRLVEIGVWEGVTTRHLRAGMGDDAVYFAVDPYPVGRLGFSTQRVIARSVVCSCKNGTVVWIRDTGVNAANRKEIHEEPIDFVFIDGDHTYEGLKGDWSAWSERIQAGGIIALHDSRSTPRRQIDQAGSVLFTREVIHNDSRFELVCEVDSLTVLRRK